MDRRYMAPELLEAEPRRHDEKADSPYLLPVSIAAFAMVAIAYLLLAVTPAANPDVSSLVQGSMTQSDPSQN